MSIFVTGDTHGQLDLDKVYKKNWPEQSDLTRDDYLIVLGDFGLYWYRDKRFDYLQNFWQSRKYTVLWIDGNHECFPLIQLLPVTEKFGGTVQQDGNVIHLMRGQIYKIGGYTFFCMGGAKSIDQAYRTEYINWWKEEEPSYEEQSLGLDALSTSTWTVDFMLTHAAPLLIRNQMFPDMHGISNTEQYLDQIFQRVKFKHWYFGHYHEDKDFEDFSAVYNRIIKIG